MGRDFDFVTMDDYSSDTREIAERGASIARHLRREISDRDRLISAIVVSAGGEVRVRDSLFIGGTPEITIVEEFDLQNLERVFRVAPNSQKESK